MLIPIDWCYPWLWPVRFSPQWLVVARPITSQRAENKAFECAFLNGTSILILSFNTQGSSWKVAAEIVRARDSGCLQQNCAFQTWQGYCMDEHTEVVAACTRPDQDQAKQNVTKECCVLRRFRSPTLGWGAINNWLLGEAKSVVFGDVAHAPIDGPVPMCVLAALSRLCGFETKAQDIGRGKWWGHREEIEGREWGVGLTKTLYAWLNCQTIQNIHKQ